MLVCWLVPIVIITIANVYYLYSSQFEEKISREIEQIKFNDESSVRIIEQLVYESRSASYDKELMNLYQQYKTGKIPEHDLLLNSTAYLDERYGRNESLKMVLLWYRDDPEHLSCSTYPGYSYGMVSEYWKEDHEKVLEITETLNTKIYYMVNDGRLYMVRNLYTSQYENAATLVFLLDEKKCFNDYESLPIDLSVTLDIDGEKLQLAGTEVTEEETGCALSDDISGYQWKNGKLGVYHKIKKDNHQLTTLIRYDNSSIFSMLYGHEVIYVSMILCIIPLIIVLLAVFHKHVTKPIQMLMKGASEIEQGNLGYKMEYEPESREFQYLAESFNSMSDKLKYQFDHIYEEEIALRDARIMALQAHINPHFMNNTLEIINWEARLSGNEKVSHMIEALSVLMDAGIDRKKRPEVLLEEEMKYVNSYLYIISERFGSRLVIENNIPDKLMKYKVPRLILQPVIENAIEHGVAVKGNGTVVMSGHIEGEFLYIDIDNEAEMTAEDEAKVKRLLDFNYDTSKESSGNMGIANVNQRLRIIYGEPCGLSVTKLDDTHVRARLAIHVDSYTS